ncbi:SIMPL domain-containing protein [Noviherbaspirillum sp.]|jgi:predicted secreted protein|uniref:SIMPL domain-containing protein n=1 Tax=Noviherbaspirillum sp. TaxID=1926288 RepID=UPI0025CE0C49|nr:SIMPL domain-containing protein [Noviherbaspirillum sp.]
MPKLSVRFAALILFSYLTSAQAQTQASVQTAGTLVVVAATGEVKHANDEARATLMIEEQDKDKATAASRANLKMKQGMEIVKREDPQALLKTRGYYTYPIYGDEPPQPRQGTKVRQPVGWRVGQYLDVTTQNINGLPKTVAAAQKVLALNGLYFGLTEATTKKLEEQRIAAAYQNLADRIAAIAKALGKSASDAVLDTLDFEGSGAYVPQRDSRVLTTMRAATAESAPVEEPSFEPGETTLSMHVVGKVRFK